MKTLSIMTGILSLFVAFLHLVSIGMNITQLFRMMSNDMGNFVWQIAFYATLNLFTALLFFLAGLFFLNMAKRF